MIAFVYKYYVPTTDHF